MKATVNKNSNIQKLKTLLFNLRNHLRVHIPPFGGAWGGFLLLTLSTHATIRHVRPLPHGSADGSSWQNASADLQLQINQSAAGDTVFVAASTYLPIRRIDSLTIIDSNNRANAFVLKKDVHIYGGFPDTDTATWYQRDWHAFPSILSGDIGIPNDSNDNCYHVVFSVGEVGAACLNGFNIRYGNATIGIYESFFF